MRRSVAFLLVFFIGVGAGILATNVYRVLRPVAAQPVSWPGAVPEFKRDAAINDPSNEETILDDRCPPSPQGCYFEDYEYKDALGVTKRMDLGYQCPKYANLFDPTIDEHLDRVVIKDTWNDPEIYGANSIESAYRYLQAADLVIDSRDNTYDPVNPYPNDSTGKCLKGQCPSNARTYTGGSYYSDESVYYKQTGHKGIQTCHWSDPGATYAITVKGTYKYDQLQPTGFAEADAECSTGFKRSDDTKWGVTERSTGEAWPEKYISRNYLYALQGENSFIRDISLDNDKYGSQWRAGRFIHTLDGVVGHDGFDLKIGWATADVTWKALEENSQGHLVESGLDCSEVLHTYGTTINGTGAPFHFILSDFVQYSEWDNCGTLSIRVSRMSGSETTYPKPDDPPYHMNDCHFRHNVNDPEDKVLIKDLKQKRDGEDLHPYYFDPPNFVTSEYWFNYEKRSPHLLSLIKVESKPTGNPVDPNQPPSTGIAPHSFTAAVRKDNGEFCGGLNTTTGKDACDPSSPLGGQSRLFDNQLQYGITGEIDQQICRPGSVCVVPAGGFYWDPSELSAPARAKLCNNGYCSIPYFCRVQPQTMRGTLVYRCANPDCRRVSTQELSRFQLV